MTDPASHRLHPPSFALALERVRVATERYAALQRRRDAAYDELVAAIRMAADGSDVTLRLLASVTGITRTRVRQILSGPVSARDFVTRSARAGRSLPEIADLGPSEAELR